MLNVWAIDPERVRRGLLSVGACSIVLRDAGVGTFQITASDDDLVSRVADGWRVLAQDGGVTLLSGPITDRSPDLGENSTTFTGVSDLVHVEDRLTFPDPALPAEGQTSAAYYVRRGPAETVIRDLVHANAGTGAIAARRVDGFTVTSSAGRGSEVSTNLRFKNLLESARDLARLGGVTFDAVQEPDGRIILRFRVPENRSRSVRFTENNGGVSGGNYTITAPSATSVIVAGQGEGTARTVIERSAPSTWGRRIEAFKDQRDTDDPEQLEQSATDQLAEGAAGAGATFDVSEAPGLIYGVDFALGDRVTASIGGATISEPVREVELSYDGFGRSVKLSLGDHDPQNDRAPAWVREIRDMDARVRGLETR